MKRTVYILLACLLFPVVVSSCHRKVKTVRDTIPYVKQLAADSTGNGAFSLIRGFDERNAEAVIAIVGEPEESILLAKRLLTSDDYDNVNGQAVPDGLPDFAGEVIAVILDEANAPYKELLEAGEEERLREVAVRNLIYALDTVCRMTPFDKEHLARKSTAKVLILSSSLMSEYGYEDLDTLSKMGEKSIPVISPVHAMLSAAFAHRTGPVHIGVWADKAALGSGTYSYVFSRFKKSRGDAESTLTGFSPDTVGKAGDRFLKYIEMYRDAGPGHRLSVLLIDDYKADREALEAQLSEIRKAETFEMMNYSKVLAEDFHFIDIRDALNAECYLLMRQRNIFTHYVAYPSIRYFETAADTRTGDSPFTLIDFNPRYLSSETISAIRNVQN